MRRTLAAGAALMLGLGWFALAGPAASDAVRQTRAEEARALSTREVKAALRSTGVRPGPELRALLEQADEADAREQRWNLLVGELLSPEQRQRALALEPGVPPVRPMGDVRFVEPELPALAELLMQQHGVGEVVLPAVPTVDPWPGVDRRRRARGLLGLAGAGELDEAQAHALLAVTLEAMGEQAARAKDERALAELLPEEVRAAVMEGRLARPRGGGRP